MRIGKKLSTNILIKIERQVLMLCVCKKRHGFGDKIKHTNCPGYKFVTQKHQTYTKKMSLKYICNRLNKNPWRPLTVEHYLTWRSLTPAREKVRKQRVRNFFFLVGVCTIITLKPTNTPHTVHLFFLVVFFL